MQSVSMAKGQSNKGEVQEFQFLSTRAANNFPAGAGQIVRSNLFLLGHIPFLAGQTSVMSYRYKSTPSPLHMMFK